MALRVLAAGACGSNPLTGLDDVPSAAVVSFVDLMNAHRESVGCPALAWNRAVAAVAQAHSEDMTACDFFSHTNPDGLSPFDRLADAGIVSSAAAENIAYGYGTPPSSAAWVSRPAGCFSRGPVC